MESRTGPPWEQRTRITRRRLGNYKDIKFGERTCQRLNRSHDQLQKVSPGWERNTIYRVVVLFIVTWRGRGDAGADTITEPHDCVLVFSNRDIDVHSIQRNHNQDTIYYKWASVKMTLKFHFLWSTLFWLEESVSAVYSDWLRSKSETNSCSWSSVEVWRQHQELLHLICTPGS